MAVSKSIKQFFNILNMGNFEFEFLDSKKYLGSFSTPLFSGPEVTFYIRSQSYLFTDF